jgi:hypothetical protein
MRTLRKREEITNLGEGTVPVNSARAFNTEYTGFHRGFVFVIPGPFNHGNSVIIRNPEAFVIANCNPCEAIPGFLESGGRCQVIWIFRCLVSFGGSYLILQRRNFPMEPCMTCS